MLLSEGQLNDHVGARLMFDAMPPAKVLIADKGYDRPAVEPVIGHLKEDHRMGRNFLSHAAGDAINAILAAAGYNFRRVLAWLRLLCAWLILLMTLNRSQNYQPARA